MRVPELPLDRPGSGPPPVATAADAPASAAGDPARTAGAGDAGRRTLVLAPGPHLHAAESTASIMWWVNGSLAPVIAWGAYVFGWRALAVVAAAIAGAAAAEWG